LDPITGQPLAEEFPLDSMDELLQLLHRSPNTDLIEALRIKVANGLRERRDRLLALKRLKIQYDRFPEDLKNFIRTYLAWIFICAMWMRFWKGPGAPWATATEALGTRTRCDPTTRDEHIVIQGGVYEMLKDSYQKEPLLNQWIINLPVIFYDFQSEEPDIQEIKLNRYFQKIFFEDYCLGFSGNRTLQTAYYLIIYILNIKTNKEFNAFISEQLPNVLAMEKTVVDGLLVGMKPSDDPEKYRVLKEREVALNKPIPSLPKFDPKTVGQNVHVD
jgi:hypothetical protein